MGEQSTKGTEGLLIEERRLATERGGRSSASLLVIGTRIKMSLLGVARNPRLASKEGTIVGNSRINNSVRVLFDGRRTPLSLHPDYLEPTGFGSA
jgi:hypothetical protein